MCVHKSVHTFVILFKTNYICKNKTYYKWKHYL